MPTLIGQSGPLAGRRFELDGDVVLGRENAAITLADEETSRRHAEIRVAVDAVVIEDLGSTNGTYVDGRRIDAATTLRGGEIIKMGQSTFTLEVEVVAPEPVPAPEPDRGATRIVSRPEPVADPDATALRARPPAPSPEPIADPDVTALRPRPPKPPAPPEPPVDPGHTQLRPRPPKRPEPVGDAAEAPPGSTTLRPRPPAREPAPAAAAPPPPPPPPPPRRAPAPAAAAPAADQPFGAFAAPASKRRRGVASRKVTPALVSMATIITTAAALVVYFAGR